MGVIAFATGVMLLVSGATPTFGHRLAILSMRLPLWAVETSHFMGSLSGVVFLFVAPADCSSDVMAPGGLRC